MSKYFGAISCILVVVFTCLCFIGSAFLHEAREDQCTSTGLTRSINDFGNSLSKLIEGTNNIFISPFSIYAALTMIYLGAGGRTAEQMEESFQLVSNGVNPEQLHELFQNLMESFRHDQEEYTLLLANALFIQQTFNVNPNYINDTENFYQAKVESVDFATQGEEAKQKINIFVAENTNNRISQLLPNPLGADTVMALLNVIYFKGVWKTEFPVNQTREGIFFRSEQNSQQRAEKMPLVQQSSYYHYSERARWIRFIELQDIELRFYEDYQLEYKFLELPYKTKDVSMLLVMPFDRFAPSNFEMTSSELCRIQNLLRNVTMIEVMLPKLLLEFEIELIPILRQMGMSHLFNNSANLSGIAGGIKVSSVLHKAVIEVNEQGTEAAAVTQVVLVPNSSFSGKIFYANHPFQLYIIDNTKGLILFSGLVIDP